MERGTVSVKGFASPLLVVGVVAGVLALGLAIQTWRVEECKTDAAVFEGKVEHLGKIADAENRKKERENAAKITSALSERDAALKRLRDANSRSRNLSRNAEAAATSNKVCFGAQAYNAALREFRQSLERFMAETLGYAVEGDEAGIDAEALVKSWPR